MALTGGGREGDETVAGDGVSKPNIADLLKKLNLTEEEEVVLDFSDDEGDVEIPMVELAVVGKVLSPTTIHVHTVRAAMKPAWGNPCGLKLRAIGEKGDN
jgi:hypothetical protein